VVALQQNPFSLDGEHRPDTRIFDPTAFRSRWLAWHPGSVPIGWVLRHDEDRWLRIHSLPESKRYPDTDAEREVLLARHNTVADAIIGDAPCVLLGFDYEGRYHLPLDHRLRAWLSDAPPVMRIAPDEDDEDAEPTSIFASRVTWHPGAFDELMLDVAEDRLRFLLVNWNSGAVYAPYDGGADLIWPTETERDAARARYASWLSLEESGL
jgi:hypothetical protein